ncbi:MAG TPA: hypothetical protein VJ142_00485 [Candidatus Nanoarchaeia archaeon]|nr:hypothetical protein [Candidatus Nanoarchaeia archaeon]
MTKREIMVCECGCERCSHKWIARSKEIPIVCPYCKSPYWNKPINKKAKRKK